MFLFLSFTPSQLLYLLLSWFLPTFALFILSLYFATVLSATLSLYRPLAISIFLSSFLSVSPTHHPHPWPSACLCERVHTHTIWSPFPVKCQGNTELMPTIRFYQHLRFGRLWAHKLEYDKDVCVCVRANVHDCVNRCVVILMKCVYINIICQLLSVTEVRQKNSLEEEEKIRNRWKLKIKNRKHVPYTEKKNTLNTLNSIVDIGCESLRHTWLTD